MNFKHGDAKQGKHHRLYVVWRRMYARCIYDKCFEYKWYGGRGITLCGEWLDYRNFKDWAVTSGYKHGLTIDRIDNDSGYSPENCRWATRKQQARNRTTSRIIKYKGKEKPLAEWVEELGLNYARTFARLTKLGWPVDRAFS